VTVCPAETTEPIHALALVDQVTFEDVAACAGRNKGWEKQGLVDSRAKLAGGHDTSGNDRGGPCAEWGSGTVARHRRELRPAQANESLNHFKDYPFFEAPAEAQKVPAVKLRPPAYLGGDRRG
jgi:hypothetical protein